MSDKTCELAASRKIPTEQEAEARLKAWQERRRAEFLGIRNPSPETPPSPLREE